MLLHVSAFICDVMSVEPGRKVAYSTDFRWRMIYQRIAMGKSFSQIATNLNVATSTVHRTYQLFERTGEVKIVKSNTRSSLLLLTQHEELYVVGLVMDNPSI